MPISRNQNPEQIARDRIDAMLAESGWVVQGKKEINFNAGQGIAVREYPTDGWQIPTALKPYSSHQL